ncbi:NAD(P)-dependent dehydrogenase (short-subunit alcohol dehydrogenase family) [Saccharopolyspora lacisalsi]|uniref:NAD(P)-dependent dehydrogenase (Short-subunit alcohol dehydrogenase family) n=1 Tax=Halosaccharopolyspora lacisalsi TaxID=1000566 RepID=A0A839DPS3_9PSEU|nr:NAD(P)-dependent dehydrogenase (short-subunit alcohol dehydrogenase family) [Halosaccharopolyspora lacisalsi]
MQPEDKIALVTGGRREIGRGVVDRSLDEGAQVAVVQRRSLDTAPATHPDVTHARADLNDSSSTTSVVERVVEHLGGIGILVNNAGVMFERSVSDLLP